MTARVRSHPVTPDELENLPPEDVRAFAALLVDAEEGAAILGLVDGGALRTYSSRYPEFPAAVLPRDPAPGRPRYWWAPDLIRFRESIPTRTRSSETDEESS